MDILSWMNVKMLKRMATQIGNTHETIVMIQWQSL